MTYRKHAPANNAKYLNELNHTDWDTVLNTSSMQEGFDSFYAHATTLLNNSFPERTITVTSRDPIFVTPKIKLMLREKNVLKRKNKLEKTNALAVKIGLEIDKSTMSILTNENVITDSSQLWAKVNQIT